MLLGDSASKLNQDKFANGAITGAYVVLFNHLAANHSANKKWGKMYLCVSESASSGGHGHAWIRLESEDGNIVTTMGTYGNKGSQTFWINEELSTNENLSKATYYEGHPYGDESISTNISVNDYNKIIMFNSNPNNTTWSHWNNCAYYATNLWNSITGNNIYSRSSIGYTSPDVVASQIRLRELFKAKINK